MKPRNQSSSSSNNNNNSSSSNSSGSLTSTLVFQVLVGLILVGLLLQLSLVFYHGNTVDFLHPDRQQQQQQEHHGHEEMEGAMLLRKGMNSNNNNNNNQQQPSHLFPQFDPLPALMNIEETIADSDDLIESTLDGTYPTVTGIAILLQRFLLAFHESNRQLSAHGNQPKAEEVVQAYISLAQTHLVPLDAPYRGKSIFPIRSDDSIFISAAAYRDHLLGATLRNAYDNAKHPDKLYIGAVVQNCFGIETTCRTGVQVVGKDENGHDKTKVSDAPPDSNGIEEFCTDPHYKPYCDSGQIRVLYVNETEAVGPAVARYFASKLWGGETYFIQVDAHLQFAHDWDQRYIDELKATGSYPHSVLSAYPPGFEHDLNSETPGTRLCTCRFSWSDVEHDIIRINTGTPYSKDAPYPTQIAFIAAGFFMAHAEFLKDVPFDPFLPWCFMGEEIALSMRAWTSGWDIYAPRLNLISHQYRPGRMGLPKFWESVGRTFHRPGPGFSNRMQSSTIQRVKHMVGYPDVSKEALQQTGQSMVLLELDHYGMGSKRSWEDYIQLTNINFEQKKCRPMHWCNQGEKK